MAPVTPTFRQIILSDDDLLKGTTSYDTIQAGVEEFHKNGFTILQNAIPHDIVDKFNTQMQADALQKLNDPTLVFNAGNTNTNFSISPPLAKQWLVEDIWANKHITSIMEALIGKPQLVFAGSNINLPTRDPRARQAVHCDSYAPLHDFPVCIEVFIYLDDVSPQNGATELWPGSHKNWTIDDQVSHGRGWIKASAFHARAQASPPFQPTIPKGSIGMRDLRLWHAGMPNFTHQMRIMLGFIYYPRWFRSPMRVVLPASCRPVLEKWEQIDGIGGTEFVEEGTIDHLDEKMGMLAQLNFTQDETMGIKEIRREIDEKQGREPLARIRVIEKDYWSGKASSGGRKRGC